MSGYFNPYINIITQNKSYSSAQNSGPSSTVQSVLNCNTHPHIPSLFRHTGYIYWADLKVNTNLHYSENCRMVDQSRPFRSRRLTHRDRYRLSTFRRTENAQRWYSEFRCRDCSSEHLSITLTTIRLEPLLNGLPCSCLSTPLACWCWSCSTQHRLFFF